MIIGDKIFDLNNKYYIMGILNLTPDSFSDGGKYNDLDSALYRVEEMIAQGADIIDVGAESTRPGHVQISVEEEVGRLAEVLSALKARFDVPISLDTYKSDVVSLVYQYIDMVNDVYGLTYDVKMADVIAKNELSCCIMANKKHISKPSHDSSEYVKMLIKELDYSLQLARNAGVDKNKIMLDGGVGFGKSYDQNLITINNSENIASMGYPLLMATSNKGFMAKITGTIEKDRRDETVATTVFGALNGANFFRVHNVEANKKALQLIESIRNEKV